MADAPEYIRSRRHRKRVAPRGASAAGRIVLCVQNLSVPRDPRVWREARDLAAAGWPVSVICPGGEGLARRESIAGVEIIRFPSPPAMDRLAGYVVETALALSWTMLIVLRLRLRGEIAVLHAANPPDTFFLVGLALRPFGTRFVFDQHDVSPELLAVKAGRRPIQDWLLRRLEKASYRLADLVIAPNESYRRLALERGHKRPEDVVIVRSGPDQVDESDPAPDGTAAGEQPPVVVFCGAMDTQDGVHLLLAASAEILSRQPGALRVELIGSGGNVHALQAEAERLGIGADLTWTGWLEYDQLRRRLARATIAVSPDEDNPFTRVSTMTKVTDYLGAGLPSLVADLPENRRTGQDAVEYFVAGDSQDLARHLTLLLDDPERRRLLADRARKRAQELLWCHSRDRLLAAYADLLQN